MLTPAQDPGSSKLMQRKENLPCLGLLPRVFQLLAGEEALEVFGAFLRTNN